MGEAGLLPKSTTNGLTAKDMAEIADTAAANANLYAQRALAKIDVPQARMFLERMAIGTKKAEQGAHKAVNEIGHLVLRKEEMPALALIAATVVRPEFQSLRGQPGRARVPRRDGGTELADFL